MTCAATVVPDASVTGAGLLGSRSGIKEVTGRKGAEKLRWAALGGAGGEGEGNGSMDRGNAVKAMRQIAPDAFLLQPLPLSHKIPIYSSSGRVVRQLYTLCVSSMRML